MIIGRSYNRFAACFDEIDAVVAQLTTRTIVFNAHQDVKEIPPGSIVYNFENVGVQIQPDVFPPNQEIWDFSKRNIAIWAAAGRRATHVPVGFHSGLRFLQDRSEKTHDIVFVGALNLRRAKLLERLQSEGLRVNIITIATYGRERDQALAQAKLMINPLFYENGAHPVLRSAHCIANYLPVLSECAEGIPDWCFLQARYDDLADRAIGLLRRGDEFLDRIAIRSYATFRMCPMVLPPEG